MTGKAWHQSLTLRALVAGLVAHLLSRYAPTVAGRLDLEQTTTDVLQLVGDAGTYLAGMVAAYGRARASGPLGPRGDVSG